MLGRIRPTHYLSVTPTSPDCETTDTLEIDVGQRYFFPAQSRNQFGDRFVLVSKFWKSRFFAPAYN